MSATPLADRRPVVPGQRIRHQLHRDAHQARSGSRITLDFNPNDGIPSWHFNNDEDLLNPALWTAAELFRTGPEQGRRDPFQLDGDYSFAESSAFTHLKFGVRYDDRGASNETRVRSRRISWARTSECTARGLSVINSDFLDGNADMPTSWMIANGYYIHDHRDEVRALYGQPAGDPTLIKVVRRHGKDHGGLRAGGCRSRREVPRSGGLALGQGRHRHGLHRPDHRQFSTARSPSTKFCRR